MSTAAACSLTWRKTYCKWPDLESLSKWRAEEAKVVLS